jgi:hypothetical protein
MDTPALTVPSPCPACKGNRRTLQLAGKYIIGNPRCETCDGEGTLHHEPLHPAFGSICLGDGWDPHPLLCGSQGADRSRAVIASGEILDGRGLHAHATFARFGGDFPEECE